MKRPSRRFVPRLTQSLLRPVPPERAPMVFRTDAPPTAAARDYPLETMRAVAVFLLVAYHAIGSGPMSGLELDYPHPLRLFADFLIDLRMPFFAFIAGYVYGLRPIALGDYGSFITGKFRRLYIPGAIAATLMMIMAGLFESGSARTWADFWQVYFFPYAHYWFLQAILLIFVFFGALDMALRGRFTTVLLVLSVVPYLFAGFIPSNVMSINAAIYLLPFFLLGVVFIRHLPRIAQAAPWLTGLSVLVVIVATATNLSLLRASGELSLQRYDVQSLAMGLAVCMLAMLTLPRVARFEALGPYAFTIYLYHVFGTAGARDALQAFGITAVTPIFLTSIVCGIALPVVLHRLSERWGLTRRYILGKKR
ncbi:acyltransferase family protein [uncultured Roseobacter sp.]|uniref:acyltransferase family protein n=1 Tax=uncultured Roseobacter sp. TaxID=114847 RepID=UPI00262C47D2|nr:acyltransferase [uncultured Roseobacter sp.]